jgi:eight-cysteine-cluster-containing protein
MVNIRASVSFLLILFLAAGCSGKPELVIKKAVITPDVDLSVARTFTALATGDIEVTLNYDSGDVDLTSIYILENIPPGWSMVKGSITSSAPESRILLDNEGQKAQLEFSAIAAIGQLLTNGKITYTIQPSADPGTFSGTWSYIDLTNFRDVIGEIGGDTSSGPQTQDIPSAVTSIGGCTKNADCTRGGCSGTICQSSNEEQVVTTCGYLPEYDCYKDITCGCVNGACDWQSDEAFEACVLEARYSDVEVIA